MTFEQIKQESTYVNSCGIVFSAYPDSDEISITYNIDDDTLMELSKPARNVVGKQQCSTGTLFGIHHCS